MILVFLFLPILPQTNYSSNSVQDLLHDITSICSYYSAKDSKLIRNTYCTEFLNNVEQSILIFIIIVICFCGLLETLIRLKYRYSTYRILN